MFSSFYRMQKHDDRRLEEAVLNWKGVFFMLLVVVLQQGLAEGLSYAFNYTNTYYGTNFGNMELNLFLDLGTLAMMVFFFGRFYWENLKRLFTEFKAVYLWAPIACYFTAMAGSYVVQILLFLIRGEIQDTSNNEIVTDMLMEYPWQLLLLTVFVAPITEESIFRAALCRSMTSHKNILVNIIGCVLSVSLFSLMHVYQFAFFATDASGITYLTFNANEFLSILSYIPMAVAFVACSYLCKNFWGSVACHMITNGVAVGVMLLTSLLNIG